MNKKPGVGFGVMLLRDGKILLGQRHEDPQKADSDLHGEGTWTMPGGKLHFQESVEQGARREVQEETGIELTDTTIINVQENIVSDAHYITFGVLSTTFQGEAQVREPDEITQWKWFSLEQLPTPLYPASEALIKAYKKNEFFTPHS